MKHCKHRFNGSEFPCYSTSTEREQEWELRRYKQCMHLPDFKRRALAINTLIRTALTLLGLFVGSTPGVYLLLGRTVLASTGTADHFASWTLSIFALVVGCIVGLVGGALIGNAIVRQRG